MIYKFKPGSWHAKRKNAQEVGQTLEQLRMQNEGHLTSENVVEAAKLKHSPLHEFFDWDDSAAAHKFRIQQAGSLISSIVVEMPETKNEPTALYCNVKKMGAAKSSYIPVRIAMSTPFFRNQIMNEAIRELDTVKKKFGHLRQLDKVFTTYKEIRKQLLEKEKAKSSQKVVVAA